MSLLPSPGHMGDRELSVARVSTAQGEAALAPAACALPSVASSLTALAQPGAALQRVASPSVALSSVALSSVALSSVAHCVAEATDARHLVPLPGGAENHRRVHALVNEYMDFVWRSLRRLGVADPDCDDGCQRVWVVVAQKLGAIEDSKVKSYLFSVVVRVASEMRRNYRRHQHLAFDELELEPTRPDAEGLVEQRRVRELLDQLLSGLSWDLRTVFVMYEIEGMSSPEIAEVLGISRGTVASRLRLAREAFQRSLQRHRARTRSSSEPGATLAPGSNDAPGAARLVIKKTAGVS